MWTPQAWYDEARREAAGNRQYTRDMAVLCVNSMCEALPGVPRQEVARRLKLSNQRRLDAVPSLAKFPELRGMRELVKAEWKGTQDGAGLDDFHLDALVGFHFYYHRYVSAGRHDPGVAACSMVYFKDSDRGPIAGKNLDTSLTQPTGKPHWPIINEHLIIDGVSSGVPSDEESPEIFPAPVMKMVGRYCRTTQEAIEMFRRYNYFWGPGNMMVIDRDHNIAIMEKSACRMAVRWNDTGYAYVTAMTQEDPAMRAFVDERRERSLLERKLPTPCADTAYWGAQTKRRHLMNDLFVDAAKRRTVDSMRGFLQHRSKRGCVAGNGETYIEGGPKSEYTVRTQVWILREGKVVWWLYDYENHRPSWENPQPEASYEGVWKWD